MSTPRVRLTGTHDATFYVQLQAELWNADQSVRKVRAVRISQKRPTEPLPGAVLTKLTINVPDSAFMPLRPEAVVVIPESMVETNPLTVEVGDPS